MEERLLASRFHRPELARWRPAPSPLGGADEELVEAPAAGCVACVAAEDVVAPDAELAALGSSLEHAVAAKRARALLRRGSTAGRPTQWSAVDAGVMG